MAHLTRILTVLTLGTAMFGEQADAQQGGGLLPPPTRSAPGAQQLPPPTGGAGQLPPPGARPAVGTNPSTWGPARKQEASAAPGLPPVPPGQVLVAIENVSAAPLDVFVDPEGGGDPVFIMSINSGYLALQPTPVGRTWRFAQNDRWFGGFKPSAEPRQRFTFDGRAQ